MTPVPQSDNNGKPELARSRKWINRGLNVLILVVIVAGVRIWQQRDIVKGVAPLLSGTLLDGKYFKLPAKPDQPVLVHFWATWCPICRAELGTLDSMAQSNPNVISIAMQSGNSVVVQKYMKDQDVSFPVINDSDSQISSKWGVRGVPASFIIDTDGNIRFVEIGYTTSLGLRMRLWLASF